jgi:uncharacterized membrane protein
VGIGSTGYRIVFMLHILSIVIGFGGVMLNGIYGAEAKKRKGPAGAAIGEANLAVTKIAEKVIVTIPLWGIALVLMSDGVWEFTQAWVVIAIVLFVLVMGFATGVQLKNQKRMVGLAGELAAAGPPPAGASGPPPQVAEMEALEKKLGMGGAFLSLMVVVLIYLMVFKPGL